MFELCAGVGLVSVAMLAAYPAPTEIGSAAGFRVVASDISRGALAYTRRNAARNLRRSDQRRLETMEIDVLRPLPAALMARVAEADGLDVLVGATIDTGFASTRDHKRANRSAVDTDVDPVLLPMIRELLGSSGRAWVVSRANPESLDRNGQALAAELAQAGLDVDELVRPRDVGYFPDAWRSTKAIPELMRLRPRADG